MPLSRPTSRDEVPDAPVPDDVAFWLGRLRLLNGLPFNYLVPDVRMLPAESIRFFSLDFAWIDALTDGAFSIGRSTVDDVVTDEGSFKIVALAAGASSASQRQAALQSVAPEPVEPPQVVTGFLIRSAVIAGWPSLEIDGFSDAAGENALGILRMEVISPSILICLFAGRVARVDIHEPAETLHSGIADPPSDAVKSLRYLAATGSNVTGDAIAGSSVAVPFRSAESRVIRVNNLAANLRTGLGAYETVSSFTAAEFGLEMVQGAQSGSFVNPT